MPASSPLVAPLACRRSCCTRIHALSPAYRALLLATASAGVLWRAISEIEHQPYFELALSWRGQRHLARSQIAMRPARFGYGQLTIKCAVNAA